MNEETKRTMFGLVALSVFIAAIPAANWTLDHFGFWDFPWLGPVASGVVWVGVGFVARDVVQLTLGKWVALIGIAVGIALSVWLANPLFAAASGWAFACSELLDFAIYSPLQKRRFVLAVVLSSIAGSLLDSALFLRIAFGSYEGWWQLAVVKSLIVLAVTPLAWGVRRALSRDESEG